MQNNNNYSSRGHQFSYTQKSNIKMLEYFSEICFKTIRTLCGASVVRNSVVRRTPCGIIVDRKLQSIKV
jgi:hypothetical protein